MQNQEKFISAGIDVSSEKLDIFLMNSEETGKHRVFKNTKNGIQKLINWLQENQFEDKVVMESTGRYHELVAVTLFAEGFDTYVINPLRAKKYQTAQIRKLKTDKNDAKILAEVAMKEKKLDKFTLSKEQMKIKKRIAFIRSLEKKLQELNAMMNNHEKSQSEIENSLSEIETQIKKSIKEIEKYKAKLEQDIVKLVFSKTNKEEQNAKEVLTSISGVSPYYAALIYFFYSTNENKKSSAWIAYTGLEVSIQESGKWVGKGRISKRGNKYLRKRNFSAAWGAIMNDSEFRKYYDQLKEKGRKHKEALVIIGKKILRIAHSCLKYNQKFDVNVLKEIRGKLEGKTIIEN